MHTIETNKKESEFIAAYLEAVDFTELGGKSPAYIGAEIGKDFLRESIIDCLAFYSRIACYLSDDNIASRKIYQNRRIIRRSLCGI
jgi:hypothetical protein